MKDRGFTLVEMLVVVVVLGILAALVIPALVRSRVAANEGATIGDVRTVIGAQAAYATVNAGFYDSQLSCLTSPGSGCIPSYPPSGPSFLDSELAALQPRSGYYRALHAGPFGPIPFTASASSTRNYRYDATPIAPGQTGVRGFAGADTGRICWTPDGTNVPEPAPGELNPDCNPLD